MTLNYIWWWGSTPGNEGSVEYTFISLLPGTLWLRVVDVFGVTCNILTSDPAKLSNKKCTCVNNRCISSKISGDNLECRRVEFGANVTLTGSRWMSHNNITRCNRKFGQFGFEVWSQLLQFEAVRTRARRDLGPQGPQLSSLVEWERSAAIAGESWGSTCCSLCSVSNSPLTHNLFANLSNKVRGIFF